jgi:hypothetical protein
MTYLNIHYSYGIIPHKLEFTSIDVFFSKQGVIVLESSNINSHGPLPSSLPSQSFSQAFYFMPEPLQRIAALSALPLSQSKQYIPKTQRLSSCLDSINHLGAYMTLLLTYSDP